MQSQNKSANIEPVIHTIPSLKSLDYYEIEQGAILPFYETEKEYEDHLNRIKQKNNLLQTEITMLMEFCSEYQINSQGTSRATAISSPDHMVLAVPERQVYSQKSSKIELSHRVSDVSLKGKVKLIDDFSSTQSKRYSKFKVDSLEEIKKKECKRDALELILLDTTVLNQQLPWYINRVIDPRTKLVKLESIHLLMNTTLKKMSQTCEMTRTTYLNSLTELKKTNMKSNQRKLLIKELSKGTLAYQQAMKRKLKYELDDIKSKLIVLKQRGEEVAVTFLNYSKKLDRMTNEIIAFRTEIATKTKLIEDIKNQITRINNDSSIIQAKNRKLRERLRGVRAPSISDYILSCRKIEELRHDRNVEKKKLDILEKRLKSNEVILKRNKSLIE